LYGSECWATKVSDERRVTACDGNAKVEMDVWSDTNGLEWRIRYKYIRGSLKVAPVTERMRSNRLAKYGHVMQRDESHITKRVMSMNVCMKMGKYLIKDEWTL
jgi:hypothetical protein